MKLLDPIAFLNERRQYGLWSDFLRAKSRQRHTYRVADLGAGADLAATVIFAPARRIKIDGVYITPDGSAAGVDASNTSAWTVTDGSNTIVTKTFLDDPAFPADNVQTSLGTVNYSVIESGGRVELAVTNGTSADLPPVEVTIEYTDLEAFPEDGWEVIAPDDGVASISDGVDGVLTLEASDTTAADNDEIYVRHKRELLKFADGKPLVVEALLKFTEANTDDANVIFGLMDAPDANTLIDDGGGPKANSSLACFYKIDGETTWRVRSGVGSTTKTTVLDADGSLDGVAKTAGGANYQRLRIEVNYDSSTGAVIDYFIGTRASDGDWAMTHVAKHYLTFTGATEMAVVAGIKNGGANKETLYLDYVGGTQLR